MTLDIEIDGDVIRVGRPTPFSTDWRVVCTPETPIGDVRALVLAMDVSNATPRTCRCTRRGADYCDKCYYECFR